MKLNSPLEQLLWAIGEALEDMKPREVEAVVGIFGLAEERRTMAYIAADWGRHPQTVMKTRQEAIRKLHHPGRLLNIQKAARGLIEEADRPRHQRQPKALDGSPWTCAKCGAQTANRRRTDLCAICWAKAEAKK